MACNNPWDDMTLAELEAWCDKQEARVNDLEVLNEERPTHMNQLKLEVARLAYNAGLEKLLQRRASA